LGALAPDQRVVDLVNLPERSALEGRYTGICW